MWKSKYDRPTEIGNYLVKLHSGAECFAYWDGKMWLAIENKDNYKKKKKTNLEKKGYFGKSREEYIENAIHVWKP